eukprot:TRINITY_DN23129_c0_g1_i1.p1 TRINITY_DN23129_c0_g1~~TRINITY_DN23129_c0_g1_i1.p1  ORF type:complete len:688 (+),score=159.33 TRINITY_DN23129_c0_g1_i1:58-2064(+)
MAEAAASWPCWAQLAFLLCCGRAASLFVYVSTWLHVSGFLGAKLCKSAERAAWVERRASGADLRNVPSLLLRYIVRGPVAWPVHVLVSYQLLKVEWAAGNAALQAVATTACVLLLGKAVLRFGCPELGNYFVADRVLCVCLCALSLSHPVWLYWSTVASCVAAYVVGNSVGFEVPYSNYLGFELCRWVCCYSIVGLLGEAAGFDQAVCLAAVILSCGDYYFRHARGKINLAPDPTEWVLSNRIECLVVNSYLRGWNSFIPMQRMMALASFLRMMRVPMCAGGVVAEAAGSLSLLAPEAAALSFAALAGFHASVFALSGLCDWEGVVLLSTAAATVWSGACESVFSTIPVWVAVLGPVWCLCSARWGSFVQAQLMKGGNEHYMILFDSADMLMCWWDSPYMRMYTYKVETDKGWYRFPVTLFSPYDSILTDIHTRLNIVGQGLYTGLDPSAEADAGVARSGVWGLLVDRFHARDMYALQDDRSYLPFYYARAGAVVEVADKETGERHAVTVASADEGAVTCDAEGGGRVVITKDWWQHGAEPRAVRGARPESPTDLSSVFWPTPTGDPWVVTSETGHGEGPAIAVALRRFVTGLNRIGRSAVGRALWRWPHFPGEDFAPDFSPVVDAGLPTYSLGVGPIRRMQIVVVKTFYTGTRVHLAGHAVVGEVRL